MHGAVQEWFTHPRSSLSGWGEAKTSFLESNCRRPGTIRFLTSLQLVLSGIFNHGDPLAGKFPNDQPQNIILNLARCHPCHKNCQVRRCQVARLCQTSVPGVESSTRSCARMLTRLGFRLRVRPRSPFDHPRRGCSPRRPDETL